jgi:TolB-like protein
VVVLGAGGVAWWQPWAPDVEPASIDRMAFKLPEKPSIAVLPFTNMSSDKDQEYFADGMTEDIITDLSKISGLFVIARNSSFQYKGKSPDVRTVGRELGVKYVLEGSVRRAGGQVRINAQLVDATTGGHIWAERYDGELKNVFALQDKVTAQIVASLSVTLTASEGRRLAIAETDNPRAYDAFLKGWEHYRRWNLDSFGKAVPFFKKAIDIDPNYSRAHAALASVYWHSWRRWGETGIDWPEGMGVKVYYEALNLAKKHLKLALARPTSLTYQVSANVLLKNRQYEEAIAEARRAVTIDPNDPDSYAQLAYVLAVGGRPGKAVSMIEKAMRLDPHFPPEYLGILGLIRFALGDLEKAAALLERKYARNPKDQSFMSFQIAANALLGRDEVARKLMSNFDYYPTHTITPYYPRWPFKDVAVFERLGRGMVKAGICCLAELEQMLKELRQAAKTKQE